MAREVQAEARQDELRVHAEPKAGDLLPQQDLRARELVLELRDALDLRLERRQQSLALRGHGVLLGRWPRVPRPARATGPPVRAVPKIIRGHHRACQAGGHHSP